MGRVSRPIHDGDVPIRGLIQSEPLVMGYEQRLQHAKDVQPGDRLQWQRVVVERLAEHEFSDDVRLRETIQPAAECLGSDERAFHESHVLACRGVQSDPPVEHASSRGGESHVLPRVFV